MMDSISPVSATTRLKCLSASSWLTPWGMPASTLGRSWVVACGSAQCQAAAHLQSQQQRLRAVQRCETALTHACLLCEAERSRRVHQAAASSRARAQDGHKRRSRWWSAGWALGWHTCRGRGPRADCPLRRAVCAKAAVCARGSAMVLACLCAIRGGLTSELASRVLRVQVLGVRRQGRTILRTRSLLSRHSSRVSLA